MAKRLTWKREPNERGLARVVQGERGFILSYDGERVGQVYPKTNGLNKYVVNGWWWTARSDTHGIPLRNTCGEPVATADEAKEACMAYARRHLYKEG